jgi:hypothetical protein
MPRAALTGWIRASIAASASGASSALGDPPSARPAARSPESLVPLLDPTKDLPVAIAHILDSDPPEPVFVETPDHLPLIAELRPTYDPMCAHKVTLSRPQRLTGGPSINETNPPVSSRQEPLDTQRTNVSMEAFVSLPGAHRIGNWNSSGLQCRIFCIGLQDSLRSPATIDDVK